MKVERETVLELINDLLRERDALRSNLASVQARCTGLLDETRALRAALLRPQSQETAAKPISVISDVIVALWRTAMKHGIPSPAMLDGTGSRGDADALRQAREQSAWCESTGLNSWRAVLSEEVAEAFATKSLVRLRSELIDVAVAAIRWAQAIDARMDVSDEKVEL